MLSSERDREDGIDMVAVMTPNDDHVASCVACLEAGFHVICDKPLANTTADIVRIIEAAERKDRLVCVTHNYSGYPMVRQMRALLRAGERSASRTK